MRSYGSSDIPFPRLCPECVEGLRLYRRAIKRRSLARIAGSGGAEVPVSSFSLCKACKVALRPYNLAAKRRSLEQKALMVVLR
jgi:hypothetical protein